MKKILNYIDGSYCEPFSQDWLDNYNPSKGVVYSKIASSSSVDVDNAYQAAEKAFPSWSNTTINKRSAILSKIADLIEDNLDKLAEAESLDNGKPLSLAKSVDIPRASSNFKFFAQTDVPSVENDTELHHGNIWYDTVNAMPYIYTKIDVDHFVWLSLQSNETESSFESLSKSQILSIDHPIDGELIYNNTDQEYVFYNGRSWKKIITEDL